MALMLMSALASALIMVAALPLRSTMPWPTAASTQHLSIFWMAETRPALMACSNLEGGGTGGQGRVAGKLDPLLQNKSCQISSPITPIAYV